MSNAIDFGVVDDSEEPAVYTTLATPISALARVNLVLHEHPLSSIRPSPGLEVVMSRC